jgi:hypothetical protein
MNGIGTTGLGHTDDFRDGEIGLYRLQPLSDQIGFIRLEAVQRKLVFLPSSFAARITRIAISLRLAINILEKLRIYWCSVGDALNVDGCGQYEPATARCNQRNAF